MQGLPSEIRACLFDLDGVLTRTAQLHAAAWQEMFDEFLRARAAATGGDVVPFDLVRDYEMYVSGRLRQDGVRTFLASRGIELSEGDPTDPPSAETIHGLGNRKNELVRSLIRSGGVETYPGAVQYAAAARAAGLQTAVVSASKNTSEVLAATRIQGLFDAVVDGNVAEQERTERQAGARHVPRGGRAGSASDQRKRRSSRTRSRASRPGRAGASATSSASTVPARQTELPTTAPTSWCPTSPTCSSARDPRFAVEPWSVRETRLDLDVLPQTESMFALSNGHIGLRGNLDEGEPHGLPGTYLNRLLRAAAAAVREAGYGYPESGQTIINVTNGKIIRLLVDDEPFDVRYGDLDAHERDARPAAGVLRRAVRMASPAGTAVRVRSTRLVSFAQRAVGRDPVRGRGGRRPLRIVVQSELVANEPLPTAAERPAGRGRARVAARVPRSTLDDGARVVLVHRTRQAGCGWRPAMDHLVEAPDGTRRPSTSAPDVGRVTVAAELAAGAAPAAGQVPRLRLVERSARCRPSATRSTPRSPRPELTAGTACVAEQRTYLDEFWDRADVEIDGDAELQQAVRFALFHVLQAGARAERRAIAAKGLTGPGYDGHTFWDTETLRAAASSPTPRPHAAADALRWRHSTLDLRTGAGRPTRPRGRRLPLAHDPRRGVLRLLAGGHGRVPHQRRHRRCGRPLPARTGDVEFEREIGLELLVETARLWRSLGHHDPEGRFRIDGVTGPDEYSAIADNNVYTNLMAQRNLRGRGRRVRAPSATAPRSSASPSRRPRRGATPPTPW